MPFCSAFDEVLAHHGPAAVFLLDREAMYRFAPNWTRDAWTRSAGPHEPGWTWWLARDHASGFVQLVMTTSPTLLGDHPRFALRRFDGEAEALKARDALGRPAVTATAW